MPILELKNVSFKYPSGFEAITDLNLSFEKGEKVAIIGENGAGKTTTAKLLNGLLRPTQGALLLNGKDAVKRTTAQVARDVGYVFQNPDDQIFNNDVYSEIIYTPKYYKLSEDEIKRRADKALKMIHMEKTAHENPYNLSYSLRKFVTIGAVIAMETEVMIFDEPTAGQDKDGMDTLDSIIETLHQEGKTILTITHDMEFVVRNFDRVIVMAHGNVIADGDKRDIFWQHDILKEAAIHQPYIAQLAHEINMREHVLDVDEFAARIHKK